MPGCGGAPNSARLRVLACMYDGDETWYGEMKSELDSCCG